MAKESGNHFILRANWFKYQVCFGTFFFVKIRSLRDHIVKILLYLIGLC